jgi:hypothetical protein
LRAPEKEPYPDDEHNDRRLAATFPIAQQQIL